MTDTTREDRLTAIDGLRLHVDHDLPEPCLPSLMDEIDALLARAEAAEREKAAAVAAALEWSEEQCMAFATAYDGEDAAMIGEPNPWLYDFESPDAKDDWGRNRIVCVREGLSALATDAQRDALAAVKAEAREEGRREAEAEIERLRAEVASLKKPVRRCARCNAPEHDHPYRHPFVPLAALTGEGGE